MFKLITRLNRVDGVASVMIAGAPIRVVYVDLDPNKLDAYNLTLEQIGSKIQAENRDVPAAENDSAEEYRDIIQQGYSADYAKKLIALTERLDGNLASFKDSLLILDKREILERAGEATLMSDAHYYLTAHHVFEESELDYLLLFQDPLEVVTDVWAVKREDISDLSYSLHDVFDKKDALHGNYALAADAPGSQAEARLPSGMKQAEKKPSISEKLRVGKEKADANRAKNPTAKTKTRGKERSD